MADRAIGGEFSRMPVMGLRVRTTCLAVWIGAKGRVLLFVFFDDRVKRKPFKRIAV